MVNPEYKWYEIRIRVHGLAGWLESELSYFAKPADVIYFFEKPWKWSREYELWKAWAGSDDAEMREALIVAVDEETSLDQVLAQREEAAA